MPATHVDFPSALLRNKILTESQLRGARQIQRQTNERLANVLVDFGYASAEQVQAAVAEVTGSGIALPGIGKVRIERLMHRNSIAVNGDTAAAYCLVKLLPMGAGGLFNVQMHIKPIKGVKIKRLRQVAPEIRPIQLTEREGSHLVGQLGTLVRDKAVNYVIDVVVPRRPDGKWVIALLEVRFDTKTGKHESVTEPIEVVYTSVGHGYINAEVAKHIDEIQIAELNQSLQSAIEQGKAGDVQKVAEQIMKKGEVMGKAGAKKTMLAKQVLQEMNAGGRVSKKTQPGAATSPMVERQATIRYYHRRSPERMFPLLVVISPKAILEVVQAGVVQKQSEAFHVELESTVEIEPILPGCDCFPPREQVRIESDESTATFWVVPRVLGEVMHPRVIVRQDGTVLAEVPLEICVAKQTLTVFVGALNFGVPFVSMLLKQSSLSLSSPEAGAGFLAVLASWVLLMFSPEVLAGLLLVATVGLYFWLRPRQRDVFWDIQPAPSKGHERA